LRDVEGTSIVQFNDADVVRHPLVARIIRAYAKAAATETKPLGAQR
jgi:phosphate starvation-inducible PhoH-like protein